MWAGTAGKVTGVPAWPVSSSAIGWGILPALPVSFEIRLAALRDAARRMGLVKVARSCLMANFRLGDRRLPPEISARKCSRMLPYSTPDGDAVSHGRQPRQASGG